MTDLKDLSKEEHTKDQILQESQKLCSYVLGLCNVEAEKVIIDQKLNSNNPVHILGLTGTFISDIILRDFKAMVVKIENYEKQDKEQITNDEVKN